MGSLHTMTVLVVTVVSILSNWSTICKICNRTEFTYNWFTILIYWFSIIYLNHTVQWRLFLNITVVGYNAIELISMMFNKHECGHRIISGGNTAGKQYNNINHELHSINLCKDNQNINNSNCTA